MEQTPQAETKVVHKLIEDEMKKSYLDYSMSVIVGRALPDVRDGLKPVHRRILFAMNELGITSDKPYKKSARIVGEVLGKFHPHGDTAVYDSMVRMTQPFSLRYPLLDGQGNFGSIDGDNAAAMRYTEIRLAKIGEELLTDIEKETVSFVDNFDGSLKEPTVLPSRIPNLLLNGSSGIAVGMATNIPPHNMVELIDGTIAYINNPQIPLNELMTYIKGPDFPTGGAICGRHGIIEAYSTGKGKILVKAKSKIEDKQIIIDEIPYMVNKSQLIEQIAELVKEKKISGISDLRDESDKEGIRVVIELKSDAQPEVVLNQLYKHSRLQVTFGIIMLALVNNEPKILNLPGMIYHFVEHRKDVVTKKTQFELRKAEERAHIIEGLIIALNNIDEIVPKIKASKDIKDATDILIKDYSLTEIQAKAILDMRLQKLASLEQEKIRDEHKELLNLIIELKSILADQKKILAIIKDELIEIKKLHSDSRKTDIEDAEYQDIVTEDLIKDEKVVITITHEGYIKRIPIETYKEQKRGGKGVIAAGTREGDFVKDVFIANTHSYLLFFTNKGQVHWVKVYDIPEASRQSLGKPIVNIIDSKDKISAVIPVLSFEPNLNLILATKNGTVKKTNLLEYSRPRAGGIIGIILEDDDELISAELTNGEKDIILATSNGMAIRFNEEDVRAVGRSSKGVRGIMLKENDLVIGMEIADDTKNILTITQNGYGKQTTVTDYRRIGRGGVGVINIKTTERNGKVISIKTVDKNDDVIVISKKGIIIRIPTSNISEIGRNTQGVTLMRLDDDDEVVAAAKLEKDDENSNDGDNIKDNKDNKDDDVHDDKDSMDNDVDDGYKNINSKNNKNKDNGNKDKINNVNNDDKNNDEQIIINDEHDKINLEVPEELSDSTIETNNFMQRLRF